MRSADMTQALLQDRAETAYARDLGRAFGGALLFGLPLLMTMEMWNYGLTLDGTRLAIFLLSALSLLFGLAHFAGFTPARSLGLAALEVFAALAVGFISVCILLALFGVLEDAASPRITASQVALQVVPAAIGALLARRQFGSDRASEDEGEARYPGELFLMVAGALFLALNIAPTEEARLISYMMGPWQAIALMTLSLGLMHTIVYMAGFAGQEEQGHPVSAFFHFTLAGYGLVLLTCAFVLWIFGSLDGHSLAATVDALIVLGFPGAIGAAAARLLI